MIVRESLFKKLGVSALVICMLGSLGGWETGEDELRAALAPMLVPVGSAARLYFATQCSRDNEGTFAPFPGLALAPATANATSLDAVRAILRNERGATVEDRSGIMKITLGIVPTDLLNTRIARLPFASEARWTPYSAIETIRNAPEVQTAMQRLNIRFLGGNGVVDIILGPSGDDRYPHLPSSLKNLTMDQALDAVAKTFRDLVVYGVCTRPNGQAIFWIDETPLTACPSHLQVYSCFDPPGSKHLPGPIELSPDPSRSPRQPRGPYPAIAALGNRYHLVEVLAAARDFASNAELYVHWFDQAVSDETTYVSIRELHEILGLLQAAGARLKGVSPGDEAELDSEKNPDNVDLLRRKLPVDAYAVVFDPLEYDPTEVAPPIPVMATISDDLGDIHRDLMEGLALFRNGHTASALWHWQFMYYTHWGRHLSHAQSAIWEYLSQGNWA